MKALPLHDMRRSPQDFETGRVTIAREADVDAAPAEPEVEQGDVGQPGRQLGIHDVRPRGASSAMPKIACNSANTRPRSPGLWDVGTEVLHRKIGIAALARIEFRQLIEQEVTGGTRNARATWPTSCVKPYRFKPSAIMLLSCGQTEPF